MKKQGLRIGSKRRARPLPYMLLVPMLLLLITFSFFPFLRSVYLTFFVTDPLGHPGTYVGTRNWVRVFESDTFAQIMKATFHYAALVGVMTFFLAMFLAFLSADKRKYSRIYQTMFALPIAIASVPIASIAMYVFGRYGLLNGVLGTENIWLAQESTAIYFVAMTASWAHCGSSYIFLLVGFRNVPDELIESAKLDGAGYIKRFFKIYCPIASPQIFFVMFLNIVGAFKSFALIRLLVQSGPNNSTNVLIYALYSFGFSRGRFETACVYALILCFVIFVVTRIQLLLEKRMVHYQ